MSRELRADAGLPPPAAPGASASVSGGAVSRGLRRKPAKRTRYAGDEVDDDADEEDEEGFEGEEDDEKEENDLAGIDPFDLSLARFIEAGGQELGPQTDPLSVKERHARFKIIPRIEVGPW